MRSSSQILSDIDSTLDQLIDNAMRMRKLAKDPHSQIEVAALQQRQEKLLDTLLLRENLLQL